MKRIIHFFGQPANSLVAFGVIIPLYLVYLYISTYALPVPFSDQWELSGSIAIQVDRGEFPLESIFAVDKGHRIVFTNLVTALSAFIFDWNPRYEAFLNPLLGLAILALYTRLFYSQYPDLLRWVAVPFSAMVFSLYQLDIWLYSWNSSWLFSLVWFLTALFVLQSRDPGWVPLCLAIGCAWCATLSLGNGFISWAVLLPVLWMFGYRRWFHYAIWIAASVAGVYVQMVAGQGSDARVPVPGVGDLPAIVQFALTILGSPFSLHFYEVSLATGLGVLALLMVLANLVYLWRRDWDWRRMGVWLALIGFTLVSNGLTAAARFNPDELFLATAARYAAATMPLWISLVALGVVVINHIQRVGVRERWHDWLLRGNFLFLLLLIPLHIQANIVVMQLVATEFDRVIEYQHVTPTAAEQCVRDYPLYRDETCLQEFPFRGGASPYYVYRLAAYRLAIFAHEQPVNILPTTYQAGSPVIIDTPSIWANTYVWRTLLDEMPDLQLFHLAPDTTVPYPDPLPLPITYWKADLAGNTLAELQTFVKDAQQVWYIGTSEKAENDAILRETFADWGYLPTVSPITLNRYQSADLLILRYQRAPETLEDIYHFQENIALQAWSIDGLDRASACNTLSVQTWWRARRVPDFNYSATLVLSGEGGVIRSDGQLANIPMQLWEAGTLYLDERTLVLPCDLPGGTYDLLLGIYNYETVEDLPVTLPDGTVQGGRAYLTTITIPD